MEPISRVPIVQQVEERIRELIQEEQYQPGKKLPPEMELCQRLGVGRGTVREAFRLLQAKGVVEIKPGRGAFVAENPAERDIGAIDWLVENERELRDSIEIRTALEPMAARRMAERCNTEDIRRLENIHRSFLSAIQEGDAAMIGRLDEQFHSAIQFLQKMERLLDATKFPQAFSTPRAFGGDAAGRGGAAAGTGPKTGKLATFTVRVIFRQNASWQGSVSWLEGGSEQRFRSVLELLLLLDSALTSVNRMEKSG